jgi:hypothetical protein
MSLHAARVERGLSAANFLQVFVGPLGQRPDGRAQRAPERREFVLHAWWNFGVNRAFDQTVALQIPQRLREHLLRDAPDRTPQFVETARLRLGEDPDDERRPLVGDSVQDCSGRTVFAIDLRVCRKGRLSGFHMVTGLLSGAYLYLMARYVKVTSMTIAHLQLSGN